MKTSVVLNKAADLIEERGWGTGTWATTGPLCIEGAIAAARGDFLNGGRAASSCNAVRAIETYLARTSVFLWNDDLYHDRVRELIDIVDHPAEHFNEIKAQAQVEGQAKVIAVLRATALIEAAKESAQIAGEFGGCVLATIDGAEVTFSVHAPITLDSVTA